MASTDILIALRRIMRAIDLHSKKLEHSAGLTVPQILILQTVADAGQLGVSQIARRVSLSQATVTSVVDRLVRKNLVTRKRSEKDRRVVSVALTGHGEAQLEDAPGLLQEEFVNRFGTLEPWEQKMLTAAVERIASLMDAETVDASPILQTGDILPQNNGDKPPTS